MKIPQKYIQMFNSYNPQFEPCFNENYNKSKGLPSMKQWNFMIRVARHEHGSCGRNITTKMIKEYIETFGV